MVVVSSSFAVVSASCEVPPIGPIALVLLDVLFL